MEGRWKGNNIKREREKMENNYGKKEPVVSLSSVLANLYKEYRVEEINTEELMSVEEGDMLGKTDVISLFEEISGGNNSEYYVGITGRVRDREKEHNAEFLAVVDCPSVDKANGLEELANAKGFNTGGAAGNGHEKGTTEVYIYKIIPNITKE